MKIHLNFSIFSALGAALLFGASTPFAKSFIGEISPILLAGLLYLGSGIGLLIVRCVKDKAWQSTGLLRQDWWVWAVTIFIGGVIAPILLMTGLMYLTAATSSLLLNFEPVMTALLAWIVFREHTSLRMILGMALIILGGVLLSWQYSTNQHVWLGTLAIAAACLCWAIDNNLTRKIAGAEVFFLAGSKGLIAGIVNISLALLLNVTLPSWQNISWVLLVGFLGYGISLVLFVLALRDLGTGRAGAYFATAPFIGAIIAVIFFHSSTNLLFWLAAGLMGIGVWLHLTEHHEHIHTHEYLLHSHYHKHDLHHQHEHDFPWDNSKSHSHSHEHHELTHSHQHYPDIHHRH